MNKDSVIIIFGFSGSGKSTIANMVGKEYGLRIVHPSSILRGLLEKKSIDINKTKEGKGFWETQKGMNLFKERLKDIKPMDMVSDKILLKELSKGNIVMDSWSMPWLYKKGIKVYLKGNPLERAKRVSKRSKISLQEAQAAIKVRDIETRKMFKRVYGFDIKRDLEVFDLVINTTPLNQKQVFNKVADFLNNRIK